MGEYTTARSHCDQGLALNDATAQRVERPHAGGAPAVKSFLAMEFLPIDALIKGCLGYPAQALRRSQQALAEAQASSPYDLAFVQSYAVDLHRIGRRPDRTARRPGPQPEPADYVAALAPDSPDTP